MFVCPAARSWLIAKLRRVVTFSRPCPVWTLEASSVKAVSRTKVEPVLDGPLRADGLRESLRAGLPAGQVVDDVDRLAAALAGLESVAVPDGAGDLGGVREVETVGGQSPAPRRSPCDRGPRCGRRTSLSPASRTGGATARKARPGSSSPTVRSAPVCPRRGSGHGRAGRRPAQSPSQVERDEQAGEAADLVGLVRYPQLGNGLLSWFGDLGCSVWL